MSDKEYTVNPRYVNSSNYAQILDLESGCSYAENSHKWSMRTMRIASQVCFIGGAVAMISELFSTRQKTSAIGVATGLVAFGCGMWFGCTATAHRNAAIEYAFLGDKIKNMLYHNDYKDMKSNSRRFFDLKKELDLTSIWRLNDLQTYQWIEDDDDDEESGQI